LLLVADRFGETTLGLLLAIGAGLAGTVKEEDDRICFLPVYSLGMKKTYLTAPSLSL
jgi:hypothetical protein